MNRVDVVDLVVDIVDVDLDVDLVDVDTISEFQALFQHYFRIPSTTSKPFQRQFKISNTISILFRQ